MLEHHERPSDPRGYHAGQGLDVPPVLEILEGASGAAGWTKKNAAGPQARVRRPLDPEEEEGQQPHAQAGSSCVPVPHTS